MFQSRVHGGLAAHMKRVLVPPRACSSLWAQMCVLMWRYLRPGWGRLSVPLHGQLQNMGKEYQVFWGEH